MVARNDENGNPFSSKFEQVGVNHIDNLLWNAGAEEKITTMEDKVRAGLTGVVENMVEVGEEVGTAAALLYARLYGVIKSQVGIGEEQQADHG